MGLSQSCKRAELVLSCNNAGFEVACLAWSSLAVGRQVLRLWYGCIALVLLLQLLGPPSPRPDTLALH